MLVYIRMNAALQWTTTFTLSWMSGRLQRVPRISVKPNLSDDFSSNRIYSFGCIISSTEVYISRFVNPIISPGIVTNISAVFDNKAYPFYVKALEGVSCNNVCLFLWVNERDIHFSNMKVFASDALAIYVNIQSLCSYCLIYDINYNKIISLQSSLDRCLNIFTVKKFQWRGHNSFLETLSSHT